MSTEKGQRATIVISLSPGAIICQLTKVENLRYGDSGGLRGPKGGLAAPPWVTYQGVQCASEGQPCSISPTINSVPSGHGSQWPCFSGWSGNTISQNCGGAL